MGIVIGPVLRRADGYIFDTWTASKGGPIAAASRELKTASCVARSAKRALMRFLRESPMARSWRRLFGPRGGSRPALARRRLSISGSQKG
jgi:hypothetical protein